jgi:hypothetical protein
MALGVFGRYLYAADQSGAVYRVTP